MLLVRADPKIVQKKIAEREIDKNKIEKKGKKKTSFGSALLIIQQTGISLSEYLCDPCFLVPIHSTNMLPFMKSFFRNVQRLHMKCADMGPEFDLLVGRHNNFFKIILIECVPHQHNSIWN